MTKRKLLEQESNTPKKKKSYSCKFQPVWSATYQTITKSAKGDQFAYCTACNSNFGVYNGGQNDVVRHCQTLAHANNCKSVSATPKMSSIFKSTADPLSDKVTNAEVLFASFVAEHHLSFKVADHFSELVSKMFPDSEIAKKFSCKKQKTANIINEAIAPVSNDKINSLCKQEKFSLLMDESNDKGSDKCVAILVRVLDRPSRKIVTGFLSMPVCNIGTGENLFNCLQEVLL